MLEIQNLKRSRAAEGASNVKSAVDPRQKCKTGGVGCPQYHKEAVAATVINMNMKFLGMNFLASVTSTSVI